METASVGLEELKAQKEELNIRNLDAGHTFHGSVLVCGIRYYEMLIEWCSQLAARTDERISAGSGKIGRKENARRQKIPLQLKSPTATDISTGNSFHQKGRSLSETIIDFDPRRDEGCFRNRSVDQSSGTSEPPAFIPFPPPCPARPCIGPLAAGSRLPGSFVFPDSYQEMPANCCQDQ